MWIPEKPKLTRRRVFDFGIVAIFVANFALILISGEDPRIREAMWAVAPAFHFTSAHPAAWNKLIYDLNLGSLVSIFFYWLIVRLPEHQKRARIKRSFKAQYTSFKLDCIEIFLLLADGSYKGGFQETLLPLSAFRDYFKGTANGQDRWGRVADKLEGYYLEQLLDRMNGFREEISFVLNNIDIEGDAAFNLAKTLSAAIRSASVIAPGYDKKELFQFLWSVFTGWSFVTGYRSSDIIEDMIEEI